MSKHSKKWYENKSRRPVDQQIKDFNEDISLVNIDNNNYPLFYQMVINNEYLPTKSKNQFIKKFWNKYKVVDNIEYRISVIGKYLFWFDKEFIGVVDNIFDTSVYTSLDNDRYFIQITNKINNWRY